MTQSTNPSTALFNQRPISAALLEAARSCRGIGFEKPGGQASYWSDVALLEESDGLFFYVHRPGMSFHYPKRGVLRPCTVPCVVFVDMRTCTAGYLMKKARIFDLVPEALAEDLLLPAPRYEDFAQLPVSLYLNVCAPGVFRYDAQTQHLFFADMYLDVVKYVVAEDVQLTTVEKEIVTDIRARGLLQESLERTMGPSASTRGARTCFVEDFRPEIIDADELAVAVEKGLVTEDDAFLAAKIANDLLAQVAGKSFPFDEATLERLLRAAFDA